jgi:hypothetical protein
MNCVQLLSNVGVRKGDCNVVNENGVKGRCNQIEKNEMGRACTTYGGNERCVQDFGGET